jgi:ferredoxin-NADP reductase
MLFWLQCTAGSGISPIKALIESGDLEADKRSDVRLYYGTRDAAHTAYADRIPAWEKAGVKVIQVGVVKILDTSLK